MATIKQRIAFPKIVENGGNVSKAMIEANYAPATAHTPQKLTESKGFKELCDEYGLTDDLLVRALVSDIKKKPKNRKAELELGFKVKGKLSDDKGDSTRPIFINIPLQVALSYGVNQNTIRSNPEQE